MTKKIQLEIMAEIGLIGLNKWKHEAHIEFQRIQFEERKPYKAYEYDFLRIKFAEYLQTK